MKTRNLVRLTTGVVALLAAETQAKTDAEKQAPITISVTPMKLEHVPDYLGGIYCGDFPPCAVKIEGEYWVIDRPSGSRIHRFKGTNIEDCVIQPDGDAGPFPVDRPYMLGCAMWYDEAGKKLYAAMHCETPGYPTIEAPNADSATINRQIHLASSLDKGLSWKYEGPLLTRDDPDKPRMAGSDFSGLFWNGGDGDFNLCVDSRGGYIYLFTNHYVWPKPGVARHCFVRHRVARCAIADKMAPGKWRWFYNGGWTEPGLGGKASYVNAYYVMYNMHLKKYISFNYGGSISLCDDLSRQDWSPGLKIGGDWGMWSETFDNPANHNLNWHVVNEDKVDLFNGGRVLYMYTYWMQKSGGAYRLDIGPGETTFSKGFVSPSFCSTLGTIGPKLKAEPPHPFSVVSADPSQLYPFEPQIESPDPIEGRRTRRVNCASPEMTYVGDWVDEAGDAYYERTAKVAAVAGNSVEFAFKGRDIYWRVFKGEDCGKADVYVDNVLERTVDCYASPGTPFQFGFIKTGLNPDKNHTIKIVARGEKNAISKGTTIRHMLFEYAAESYRASDCFSSVMGKQCWYYQEREAARLKPYGAEKKMSGPWYTNMRFEHPNWVGCSEKDNPEVGYFHVVPGHTDAVRAWVAPHDGAVRIEGRVSLDNPGGVGVNVEMRCRRGAVVSDLWSKRLIAHGSPVAHDIVVDVAIGDIIYFAVARIGKEASRNDCTTWDPVITYVDSPGKTQ